MSGKAGWYLLVGGLVLFIVASSAAGYYLWRYGPGLFNGSAGTGAAEAIDPEQVTAGRALYSRNCAQCHGANLEGHPDWRNVLPDGTYLPPPHDDTGHTWHHSDQLLMRIIKEGGQAVYGGSGVKSGMPAFGDRLNDDEIMAILAYFKSVWGQKEREFQAVVTEQERGG